MNFFSFVLKYYTKGFFLTNFVNYGFKGLAEYLVDSYSQLYFDGFYVGGVVSNFKNVGLIKKRYYYEYSLNLISTIKKLPSLIIISSTNTFYYTFKESISLGIPSVGFVDSDLEFLDIFYPVISNNDNQAIDFFIIFSFLCVVKQQVFYSRLKIILLKLKFIFFCSRYFLCLYLLKIKKIKKFFFF